jgi:hypothetical protein
VALERGEIGGYIYGGECSRVALLTVELLGKAIFNACGTQQLATAW